MKKTFVVIGAVAALIVVATPALATDTTLHDGFKAGSLDTSKWSILTGGVGISTNIGTPAALQLTGGPDHKRIDSVDSFATGTFALARMWVNGDYQKFGFRVNAGSGDVDDVGAYFDTYDPRDGENVNTIHAIVLDCTSSCTVLFSEFLAVSWGAWHVFKVVWMPSSVEFHIDGELMATYDAAPLGGLTEKPVGVYNDRPSQMLVDWVFTTPKLVSLTYAELGAKSGCGTPAAGTIVYDLDGISCMPGNASAKVKEFSQEAGVLFTSSIHTSNDLNQWVGIFLLNEGANLTFNYNQPDPFDYNSTPPGTSLSFNDAGWGGTYGPTSPAAYLDVLGAVYTSNIVLKYPPKKGMANIHLGLHFTRDAGVTTERIGINVHVKPK
jgi:hypothetical protein